MRRTINLHHFSASKLVTVWAVFSTKWYASLLHNEQIPGAAWLSVRIAVVNASVALCLGTLAGFVLARMGRFRGRTLFLGMATAPLVMPDVICPSCRCSWPWTI